MNHGDFRSDRRGAMAAIGSLGIAAMATSALGQPEGEVVINTGRGKPNLSPKELGWDAERGEYILPELPYAKDALEPHIDALTMEIHHGKHHAAYVAGVNKALGELKKIREGGDAGLLKHWSRELSFHGSGHANHTLFWRMMAPANKGGGGQPSGALAEAIDRDFGSFGQFVAQFKAAATQVEGGGWAWLVLEPVSKRLMVIQQEKQQDMMLTGARLVLGVDVWEHAYYVKYQNKRADYVTAFMNVVNWRFCQTLFDFAIS